MSIKNYILSRSNSFQYYKNNNIKLNNDVDNLKKQLETCRKTNNLFVESINEVISSGIERFCLYVIRRFHFSQFLMVGNMHYVLIAILLKGQDFFFIILKKIMVISLI